MFLSFLYLCFTSFDTQALESFYVDYRGSILDSSLVV